MNKPNLLLGLAVIALIFTRGASAAVYIEYDSIPGESVATPKSSPAATSAAATVAPSRAIATPTPTPDEAQVDYLIKLPGVDGETDDPTPTPKPQEAPAPGGTEDINIGVGEQQSNFGILLGGGSDDESEAAAEARHAVEQLILNGAAEEGAPLESVSLNFEEVKTTVREDVKLFGIIPVKAKATVEIDADGNVKVKFPWWAKLASGKDGDEVGRRVFTTLSNVLKTKHDTIKNALNNVR